MLIWFCVFIVAAFALSFLIYTLILGRFPAKKELVVPLVMGFIISSSFVYWITQVVSQ